jgi:hypothetical protein
MNVEKYYNEAGQVGILVSSGFGAGWSTWSSLDTEFILMDKTLVEMAIRTAPTDEVETYLETVFGEDAYTYMGGWGDVVVEYLTPGTPFNITEYDGSESLTTIANLTITT